MVAPGAQLFAVLLPNSHRSDALSDPMLSILPRTTYQRALANPNTAGAFHSTARLQHDHLMVLSHSVNSPNLQPAMNGR